MSNSSNKEMQPDPRKTGVDPSQPGAQTEADFLAAYDEYADGIFRFCTAKISDPEAARDLMQETFIKTWDFCRKGGEIRQYKQFLFKTAHNLIIDLYRKKKSESLDTMMEAGFAPSDSNAAGIEAYAELSLLRNVLNTQIDELYRDVLILRFIEGLPPREIAGILDLSENAVSVRIHRGVQILKKCFPEYARE